VGKKNEVSFTVTLGGNVRWRGKNGGGEVERGGARVRVGSPGNIPRLLLPITQVGGGLVGGGGDRSRKSRRLWVQGPIVDVETRDERKGWGGKEEMVT